MATKIIDEIVLTNIADAIRDKTGTSALILPSSFASTIEEIPTDGQAVTPTRFCVACPLQSWTWKGGHGIVADFTPFKEFKIAAQVGWGNSTGNVYVSEIHLYQSNLVTNPDIFSHYYVSPTNSRLSTNWLGYAPSEAGATNLATKSMNKNSLTTIPTVTVNCTDWKYAWIGLNGSYMNSYTMKLSNFKLIT